MGVGLPDFRVRQVEKIGPKLKKCSVSQGFEREFLLFVLEWLKELHLTILTPNPLFDSRIEPENSKNYVFEQIFKHFLNFEPLLPLISGINSRFDYATLCILN